MYTEEEKSERLKGEATGLYIHIPFCGKKCPYCDFNSVAGDVFRERAYVDSLIRELDYYLKKGGFNRPLSTLYIGGGTPSILSSSVVSRLLSHIKGSFDWTSDIEVTIEANPSSLEGAKLDGYLACGINRLSLGVQSFNDAELKVLGRTHSARDAEGAFLLARQAGFTSIGIDLIYAIPGQSVASFNDSLGKAVSLKPEHLSVYGLTLEEGTEMEKAVGRGDILPVSDDVEADCFTLAGTVLREAGYGHYEISNYALPGFESRHNKRYWESRDYLGLGAGAHSCSIETPGETSGGKPGTLRWWNIKDVEGYMSAVGESGFAQAGHEILTFDEERTEALYLGLRLLKGIDIAGFKAKFNILPMELLGDKAISERLVKVDNVSGQGERLRLTPRGLLFSNELF